MTTTITDPTMDPVELEAPDETPNGWVVDSEDKAAWATDVVLSKRERLARLEAQTQHLLHLARVDLERAEGFFLPQLRAFAEAHPPKKGRTIHLATGSLAFRCVPGGARVKDPKACMAWALQWCPNAIEQKPKLVADVVKKHVETTGEIPPGVEIVDDQDTFDIKGPKS
jgi:hypothetical protein